MPMYEYQCLNEDCKHLKEEIKKFSESEETEICPRCGSLMRKTIHFPIWNLADGYWYRNGYQNQGKKDLEDAKKEYDDHQETFEKKLKYEEFE